MIEVGITDHAVHRYIERVRPVPFDVAERELAVLIERGELTYDKPEWCEGLSGAEAWCVISDGIVVPLIRQDYGETLGASTVLTRGQQPDVLRERRNRKNAYRRAARITRNRKSSRRHRGVRPDRPGGLADGD